MTRATNWCKHYKGMSRKTSCEAGVVFSTLPGHGTRYFLNTCPCFGPNGNTCSHAIYPTEEELAAALEELNTRFEATDKARKAIVDHLGGNWKRGTAGSSGRIDCPVCGKPRALSFSRSGYNGHIHATCDTDDCVRWME